MGRIATLQEILGVTETDAEVLRGMSTEELTALAAELQQIARCPVVQHPDYFGSGTLEIGAVVAFKQLNSRIKP